MARDDERDVEAERRRSRRRAAAALAVAACVIAVAATAALVGRANDRHYLFTAEYGNANGAPYDILLPLPSEADLRATCRFQGNGTMLSEPSQYGTVEHVRAVGAIAIACRLDSWKDLSLELTTEGKDANGRPATRVFLDTQGFGVDSALRLRISKTDPTWTVARDGSGDVFEGWGTFELRQTQERTPAY